MKGFIKVVGLTAVMATSSVMAAEVDQANVNSFSSGGAALAAEVNQNFNALITAINDNAQRIAELEQSATNVDVTDRSYKLQTYEIALEVPEDGGVPSGKHVLAFQNTTSITFSAGGSVSATSNGIDADLDLAPASGDIANLTIVGTSGTPSLSWSQTGNTITLTEGGQPVLVLTASPDGRILTAMDNETDTEFGQMYYSSLFVGVEEL